MNKCICKKEHEALFEIKINLLNRLKEDNHKTNHGDGDSETYFHIFDMLPTPNRARPLVETRCKVCKSSTCKIYNCLTGIQEKIKNHANVDREVDNYLQMVAA